MGWAKTLGHVMRSRLGRQVFQSIVPAQASLRGEGKKRSGVSTACAGAAGQSDNQLGRESARRRLRLGEKVPGLIHSRCFWTMPERMSLFCGLHLARAAGQSCE